MQPLDVIVGLAGDPALELLNSRATPSPGSEPIELIGDGASYLRWLARTLLIDQEDLAVLEDLFSADELDGAAADARTLREKLRPILLNWAGEKPVPFPVDVIDELNALLAQDRRYAQLNLEMTLSCCVSGGNGRSPHSSWCRQHKPGRTYSSKATRP